MNIRNTKYDLLADETVIRNKPQILHSKRGFTLIELLVVIAIIGILASIVIASLNTARQKGRDARRLSDIKQIQLALELYYDACGNYPTTIYGTTNNTCNGNSGSGLTQGGFISKVPFEILGTTACTNGAQASCYAYVGLCTAGGACTPTSYHLGASLELTSNIELQNDADACPGGTAGTACPGGGNYDGSVSNLSQIADFSGLNASAGGTQCGPTAGTAAPGGTVTCYDVTP